jgi:hypothetical protein
MKGDKKMKRATSATVFQDAVGTRLSITYSVIDDETGRIIEDNKRVTRVLTDATQIAEAQAVITTAQAYIDTLE